MDSRREAIMQALKAKLAAVSGVSAFRSRQDPVARAEGIVVELLADSEEWVEPTVHSAGVRRLSIKVDVIARGAEPDKVADPAVAGCHAAVMADTTLGGKCTAINETGIAWDCDPADLDAVRVSRSYDVVYTLKAADDTAAY